MGDYLRLLGDPCSGPITRAPYTGSGSSYLVRTTQIYQPQVGTGSGIVDVVLEFTPWNTPNVFTTASTTTGGTMVLSPYNVDCFVTNQAVVYAYRPIAACMKFVPTGPISTRQGQLGMSYSPSKTYLASTNLTARSALAACMRKDAIGSVAHEANWLPSFGDERFGGNSEANIVGAGSIQMVVLGADTASNGYLNGYFEATVVWEWEPAIHDSSGIPASGLVPSTMPPTATTLQSVLSSIKDIGRFVFNGVGMARAAYQYAAGNGGRNGGSMPLLLEL